MPGGKRLSVPGFQASGIHSGIKAKGLDLALIVSDAPASVAGVFTRSTVVGAPVELNNVGARSRVRHCFVFVVLEACPRGSSETGPGPEVCMVRIVARPARSV